MARYNGSRLSLYPRLAALALCLGGLAVPMRGQAQAPPVDIASFELQVFTLTNQQRLANGRAALTRDSRLDTAARNFSQYMGDAGFFDHVGPNGVTVPQRIQQAGYSPIAWWGENIAAGYTNPEQLVDAWMNSSSHRANILSGNFKNIGVGAAYVDGYMYITQDFGALSGGGGGGTGGVPAAPSSFRAKRNKKRPQIKLTWTDRATNETHFRLERRVGAGEYIQIGGTALNRANVTSYTDTGLLRRTSYSYRLCAVNAAGSSAMVTAGATTR